VRLRTVGERLPRSETVGDTLDDIDYLFDLFVGTATWWRGPSRVPVREAVD